MKDILKKSYDLTALTYDENFADIQNIKYESLKPFFNKNSSDDFLDLGCGTGLFYEFLLRESPQWLPFYYGIDISPGMIKEAHKKNIPRVQIGDAENIDFEENKFKYLFAFTSLGLMDQEWEKVLAEIRRVTFYGGKIFISILKKNMDSKFLLAAEKLEFKIQEKIFAGQDILFLLTNQKQDI